MPRMLLKPNKPYLSTILVGVGVLVSVYILFPSSASDVLQQLFNML